jgi:hypothetical protein
MPVTTNGTLFNCITRASAGRSHIICAILMLALGRIFYLGQTTTGAYIQNFAVNLAGSVPDYNLLHSVTQRVHIVPLFHLAAIYAQIAVIAQSQTTGFNTLYQREVMVIPTEVTTTTITPTIRFLTITVGVATATGAASLRFSLISQPHIGHAAFNHLNAIVLVSNLIINRILTFLAEVRRRG